MHMNVGVPGWPALSLRRDAQVNLVGFVVLAPTLSTQIRLQSKRKTGWQLAGPWDARAADKAPKGGESTRWYPAAISCVWRAVFAPRAVFFAVGE